MFRSARVKLTLFYLAALLTFSMSVTGTIRVLAEREYNRANDVQLNHLEDLFVVRKFLGVAPREEAFMDFQQRQEALVRDRLNRELVIINLVALVLGGILSYWFAGRTLRPIEEAHEAQARFASDASHELRTPLTNLRLENEIFLRQKGFSEREARELIKSNLEEVRRLEQLSAHLLDLTRFGRGALELKPILVEQLVSQATAQVAKAARTKQVTIEQKIAAAKVIGDQDSLRQMITIVLDNAIKYGPEKSKVIVDGHPASDGYLLAITDQGAGIAEDDMPFIFDRLYRGDKARSGKTSGYGLGLALAREIAAANFGSIEARNTADAGACFEIRLNSTPPLAGKTAPQSS